MGVVVKGAVCSWEFVVGQFILLVGKLEVKNSVCWWEFVVGQCSLLEVVYSWEMQFVMRICLCEMQFVSGSLWLEDAVCLVGMCGWKMQYASGNLAGILVDFIGGKGSLLVGNL